MADYSTAAPVKETKPVPEAPPAKVEKKEEPKPAQDVSSVLSMFGGGGPKPKREEPKDDEPKGKAPAKKNEVSSTSLGIWFERLLLTWGISRFPGGGARVPGCPLRATRESGEGRGQDERRV